MTRKLPQFLSVVCFCLLLPVSALAQCPRRSGTDQDKLCWSLQYILYAAQTDFREFTVLKKPAPDVSVGATKVPCQLSAWLNNVAMYMCSADVSFEEGREWYDKTIATLQRLQYLWQFKIESPGNDHFADAGPPGCQVSPSDTDWPHLGQCPLHLQEVRQADGTSKVHLWLNSYTSFYLAAKPPAPPSKLSDQPAAGVQSAAKDPPPTFPSCDDLCQGLKRVFEARASSFQDLLVTQASADSNAVANTNAITTNSDTVNIKLAGASACSVEAPAVASNAVTKARAQRTPAPDNAKAISPATFHTRRPEAQYVCYWPEDSPSAAESRFRDLASRLEVAMPSRWSAKLEDILDPLTGAKVTSWLALDSTNRPAVRLYLSGQSVGLHISGAD